MKKNNLKLILVLFVTIIGFGCKLLLSQPVMVKANDFISIKLHQPRSPDSSKPDQLVFVSLDMQQRAIVVDCYVKRPGDISFSKFDSHSLPVGSDSKACNLSNLITESGTYSFYVTATVGGQTKKSNRVSFDYVDERPLKPEKYQKIKLAECKYQIKYKTAADEDKTSQVALYYSTDTKFKIDNHSEVARQKIASDQLGSFTYKIENCDPQQDHFFAIRAFDQAGNSSPAVGDKKIVEKIVYIETEDDEDTGQIGMTNENKADSNDLVAQNEATQINAPDLEDTITPNNHESKTTRDLETEANYTARKNTKQGLVKGEENISEINLNPIQEIFSSGWIIILMLAVFLSMLIAVFYISKNIFYD